MFVFGRVVSDSSFEDCELISNGCDQNQHLDLKRTIRGVTRRIGQKNEKPRDNHSEEPTPRPVPQLGTERRQPETREPEKMNGLDQGYSILRVAQDIYCF